MCSSIAAPWVEQQDGAQDPAKCMAGSSTKSIHVDPKSTPGGLHPWHGQL